MAYIAKERSGECSGRIDEWCILVLLVFDEEFGDVALITCRQSGAEKEVAEDEEEGAEDESQNLAARDRREQQRRSDDEGDEQQRAIGALALLTDVPSTLGDDARAATGWNCANARLVLIL